jgi:hypothetical protein
MHTRMRLALALTLLTSLAGCVSMRPTMTSFSLDYNRVVADTRNRMILLNIVRSAYREPTYYTALTQIEGSLNVQGSFSGPVANLAGGDATSFSPTVSGSVTNAPTFTVVPLTSQEFSKGMLTPIDSDTVRLLLSQGWRSEMLAPLLVQKIQCGLGDTVFHEIDNQPSRYARDFDFGTFSRIRLKEGLPEPGRTFRVRVSQDKALSTLTGSGFDKFDIQLEDESGAAGDAMLVVTPKSSTKLSAVVPPEIIALCRARLSDMPATGEDRQVMAPIGDVKQYAFVPRSLTGSKGATPVDPSFVALVFRSPDEIVYFLGELLRQKLQCEHGAHEAASAEPATSCSPQANTLFNVEHNASGPVEVAVEHHRVRWSIPADSGDRPGSGSGARTMEVIALLNALIASETSASDFARTPSIVRIR